MRLARLGILILCGIALSSANAKRELPVWRCGWYAWPPYQYEAKQGELSVLTGLDVQLIREIAREAGRAVSYEEVAWAQHQQDLRTGERDIAAGATWTPERAKDFYFSEPYRTELNVMYVRAGDSERFDFQDVAALLREVKEGRMRLGVLQGFAYALPEVRAFVADPANAPHLYLSQTDAENLTALVEGRVDGFLVDRLVAATLVLDSGFAPKVAQSRLSLGGVDIHVMFSKVTQTPADVEAFNGAMSRLRNDGTFDRILRHYLLPPILNVTVGARWFFWLGLAGAVSFALSGVLLAQQGRYNLVGAFLLAALPAIGGGTLRDLIVGKRPVLVLNEPVYLLVVGLVVVIGYVVFKVLEQWNAGISCPVSKGLDWSFKLCDTLGLSIMTITGVRVATEMRCEPLWLWGPILAVITGAGGGIMRDIVRADYHNNTLKQGFYAEVALVWGLIFSLFLEWQVRRLDLEEVLYGALFAMAGAFGTRFLVLWKGWQNPFRFGKRSDAPALQLQRIHKETRECLKLLPQWFEDGVEAIRPKGLPELEKLHDLASERLENAKWQLRVAMKQPLPPEQSAAALVTAQLLAAVRSLEQTLHDLASVANRDGCGELCQALFASLGVLLQELAELPDGPSSDATLLIGMTSDGGQALEGFQERFAVASVGKPAEEIARQLQCSVKFGHAVRLVRQVATCLAEGELRSGNQ